ncbi:sensor domain-containing diguanylate cyclase [Desulfomicrobium sp. ZS1]|uniref:sensor domain-containing diguanylate cyclase n=1 Tax=Desulfomicrobium sp. ZS1 TaxID=2952228 RepID=UPI0020B38AF4|nr:sensor domain-containing diguanylate cyclase [Desulfomicrobium sp. ZS1]UTF49713.1 sensor domain-containing diguanylate cyclase [Desulfomicrobium sp. ZS1]
MEPLTPSSCINVLLGISRGLSHRTSIQKTLEEICIHVESYFSPRHLAFLLVDPDTGDLTFNHVVGEKTDLVSGKKLRKGTGLAGWVAETQEALLIEDTAQDPRFATQFLTAKTKGCSTVMAVPLKSGDMVYGVLELIDTRHGEPYTKKTLADFAAIAEVTAVALERAYYFQAMRRMAETDQLTGLPNKRTFDRYMEREIEVCKRYGTPSSVVLLTIENLRRLNEEYGPSSVDKIIQLLAVVLVDEVRKVDMACRIASNRFAVIMPNTARPAALDVSQRINTKIAQQSATRQMPYFSVILNVVSGIQDDVTPLLGICDTSKTAPRGFRKFRNVAENLVLLLNEEKQAMERRQYYRKNVQLAGQFENPDTGEAGDFLLDNISLNGVGFTTLLSHRLVRGALIKVRFRLDDSRRTEVTRLTRVKYLSERYVGCQFADQKSYDSDLGFYLMR